MSNLLGTSKKLLEISGVRDIQGDISVMALPQVHVGVWDNRKFQDTLYPEFEIMGLLNEAPFRGYRDMGYLKKDILG